FQPLASEGCATFVSRVVVDACPARSVPGVRRGRRGMSRDLFRSGSAPDSGRVDETGHNENPYSRPGPKIPCWSLLYRYYSPTSAVGLLPAVPGGRAARGAAAAVGVPVPTAAGPAQLLRVTPAESKVATSRRARAALCTSGSASSAPEPSPSRKSR